MNSEEEYGELCAIGYQFAQTVDNSRGWRDPISLALGELVEAGHIDFSKPEWDFDYFDAPQRARLWRKFADRYYFRSISIIPPARWRKRVIARLNEAMDKYKWAYKALADGVDPLQAIGRYRKYRNIDSDFPQTLLSQNQDYASYGTDFEEEEITQGDFIEFLHKLRSIKGVDELVLDELEGCFSALITVNINAY